MARESLYAVFVLLTKQNKTKLFILKCVMFNKPSVFGREYLLLPEFDKDFAKMPVVTCRNSNLDLY